MHNTYLLPYFCNFGYKEVNCSQPTFISGANLHFGKIELNTSLESMEKCDSENEGLS